jgi:prolyl oligopeptidase
MTARPDATPDLDPFAFLEDAADPATIAWTAEANARTRSALDGLPGRAELERRFDALLEIDTIGAPIVCGERAFYTARRGRASQAVLYVRDRPGGPERALVDPAALDAKGLVALDWWYPSPAGTYVAFGLSTNGDERSTLAAIDVASGERLSDAIPDTRFCSLAWYPDETGFYYTRFPPGAEYAARVYRHALGSTVESDEKLFGDGRAPEDMLDLTLSADGRTLVVRAAKGWVRSEIYVAETSGASGALDFVPLVEGIDALYDVEATDRGLYVRTNEGAPRFRLFEVDPKRLARDAWREVVPERSGTLDGFAVTKHGVVLHELERVRSVLHVLRADGSVETLPGDAASSVLGISADESSEDVYVLRASFVDPPTVLQILVPASGSSSARIWARVTAPLDTSAYGVAQEWFVSKDGTRVPMWVIARRDVARDGKAPAVLYGYGGFAISLVPGFTASLGPWLDAGGVYAIANLRGGGEFGEEWHRAGTRERKQNVFDDFIAAAEFLGTSGIADPGRIAVYGGSNGGLLVAALATQRPDLARAVVCAVPLTDMLRYHLFSIGRLWIAEFGDPDDAADAAVLRAYSPYHNVRAGVAYPAMFVETAESDGRVDPSHAKKFAARVGRATSGDAPIFIYVEQNAGHGAGKPRDKIVAELTDRWSFIGWRLGQRLV